MVDSAYIISQTVARRRERLRKGGVESDEEMDFSAAPGGHEEGHGEHGEEIKSLQMEDVQWMKILKAQRRKRAKSQKEMDNPTSQFDPTIELRRSLSDAVAVSNIQYRQLLQDRVNQVLVSHADQDISFGSFIAAGGFDFADDSIDLSTPRPESSPFSFTPDTPLIAKKFHLSKEASSSQIRTRDFSIAEGFDQPQEMHYQADADVSVPATPSSAN
eukprot:TRINITY_DN5456_c0_g1_i1.p1 TRINITY_DN5456_c0_g1~~TRINITY_DN5456_c0_g1_i1.p1  ORF type:complete len:253 (+),score=62.24 TRINITY_DN5456_c0_g1_i1:112-759(+)